MYSVIRPLILQLARRGSDELGADEFGLSVFPRSCPLLLKLGRPPYRYNKLLLHLVPHHRRARKLPTSALGSCLHLHQALLALLKHLPRFLFHRPRLSILPITDD